MKSCTHLTAAVDSVPSAGPFITGELSDSYSHHGDNSSWRYNLFAGIVTLRWPLVQNALELEVIRKSHDMIYCSNRFYIRGKWVFIFGETGFLCSYVCECAFNNVFIKMKFVTLLFYTAPRELSVFGADWLRRRPNRLLSIILCRENLSSGEKRAEEEIEHHK